MSKRISARRRATRSRNLVFMTLLGSGLVLVGIFLAFTLPGSSGEGTARKEYSAIPVAVNYPAPELALTGLSGAQESLGDYTGSVVLVNNWATWCPPCKAEMPSLQAFFDRHAASGFTIIAIDAGDPPAEVAGFVADYGLTFPVWLDPGNEALDAFKNMSLPNSYVIDRTGMVRLAWTGAVSLAVLEEYVAPIINE